MISPYPERLLPRPGYKIIDDFKPLSGHYLQRTMPDQDFLLENGEIDAAKVAKSVPKGNMKDLSTNLIGVFQPEDGLIELTTEGKAQYLDEWSPEDEEIDAPEPGTHFDVIVTKGQIFLPIDRCMVHKVSYNIGEEDGLLASCRVIHKPVKWNFWHVELTWLDDEGNVISEINKNWKKRIMSSARAMLSEFGIPGAIEEVKTIGTELYVSSEEE